MSERKPMTFEEWYAKQSPHDVEMESVMRDAWTAAQFALNSELGIAANEAAKDARRKVAVEKLAFSTFMGTQEEISAQVDAIIAEAQG